MVGENGAGKSTILDALCFGLFGKPFRNIRKPQLVNTVTKKGLVVEIPFTINKKEYLIRRGMKPGIFEVYKGDKLLNQSAEMKDYQEVLEKQILKINYKSFCQVIILGSATFVPFMSLTTGARREIVEDLLDLQIFSTMNILIKEKLNRNLEDQSNNLAEKRLIEEKIKIIDEHIASLQSSNEELISEKEIKLVGLDDRLKAAKKVLAADKKTETALKNAYKKNASLLRVNNEIHAVSTKLNVKCEHVEGQKEFFTQNTKCPTCEQEIDKAHKKHVAERLDKKIVKYNDALAELATKQTEIYAKLAEMEKIASKLSNIQLTIMQTETEIRSLERSIQVTEEELEAITVKAAAIDTGRIIELKTQLKQVAKDYNRLHEDRKTMLAAASLLKDDGIKSKIVKQYIPIINKLINKNLAALDFMCHFELDENFNETILSRGRDDFSYASFSEGEKFRINIAILFAWRALARLRNSISTNILILDEILDGSLDQNGTEEFMKVLSGLTDNNNVFIISHRTDQLVDKFPNTLIFQKIHGFSKIKEME
jgi:DNA repair exonuclease SbcCD ATPase subunit